MPSAVAAQDIGAGPCWGETCGDKLGAMARIAPSQPNEAMARVALEEMEPFYSALAAGSKVPSKVLWT